MAGRPCPRKTSPVAQHWASQGGFDVRFDWGVRGVAALRGAVAAVVVVDVLRFTTAVDVAVSGGVAVYPYPTADAAAAEFARAHDALLAGTGQATGLSLSPGSLRGLPAGSRLVLPSPNGATCSVAAATAGVPVYAACLRNADAVAARLAGGPRPVAVIACGERWPDGSLRPALEDLLGAGAVLARLAGAPSPEAAAAVAAWAHAEGRVARLLFDSASGRELVERGREADVACAAQTASSAAVPLLQEGAYRWNAPS